MKISILGCGWLGFPLAIRLLKEGHTVKGASRKEVKLRQLQEAGIEPYYIHLNPGPTGEKLDSFLQCDLLILTIPPGRKRADVEQFYPVAIQSVVNLAQERGTNKVLYTSSTGVYGKVTGWVDEESPVLPNTPSSRAVVKVENLLRYQNNCDFSILRLAGLAGPDRHPGKWLAGRKDLPNGEAPVNLVHQSDVIEAIVKVIEEAAWNEIFNVCAAEHPAKSEYYSWAAKKLGLESPHFLPGGSNQKQVDSSRIRQHLALRFTYDNPFDFFN